MKKPIISLLCGVLLCGCSSTDEPILSGGHDVKLSQEEIRYVESQNGFAFRLFGEALKQSECSNVLLSPLSASIGMSLVANAANGTTRQEIEETLGFENANLNALNGFNFRLVRELPEIDGNCRLALANSVWIDEDIKVKYDYTERVSAAYGAEFFVDKLASASAMYKINNWAEKKTNGMISGLLEGKLSEDVSAVLMNALYFKAGWSEYFKFDKKNTENAPFCNLDGESSMVPMMKGVFETTAFRDSNGANWLRMYFGRGNYEMILVLPDEGVSLPDYFGHLSQETIDAMGDYGMRCEATVAMPKFDLCCTCKLNSVLRALGINSAFDNADFSNLSDDMRKLNMVFQKTHIKIDEEGAEAAAVTAQTDFISPGPVDNKMEFVFDRPFAFIIHERSSDSILFMGAINEL